MKWKQKEAYVTYMKNQLKELIHRYDTEIVWFDGDWAEWWTMESGLDLYQYVRELNPGIIINNRVAKRDEFKRDFGTPEQKHLTDSTDYFWEACYTMNKSWGYKRSDDQWKSPETIVNKLVDIRKKGGNLLLNIGPDGEGNIPAQSVEILQQVGTLLQKHPIH